MKAGAIVLADKTLAVYDQQKTGFITKEDAAELIDFVAKPMFEMIQADVEKVKSGMPPEMAAKFKGPSFEEMKAKCWIGFDVDKDDKLNRNDLYIAFAGILH